MHRINSDRRPDGRSGRAAPAQAGAGEGTARAGSHRSASPWSAVRSPWLAWSGGLLVVFGLLAARTYARMGR